MGSCSNGKKVLQVGRYTRHRRLQHPRGPVLRGDPRLGQSRQGSLVQPVAIEYILPEFYPNPDGVWEIEEISLEEMRQRYSKKDEMPLQGQCVVTW